MIILGLSADTKRMMAECFAEKVCSKCRKPAERFTGGKGIGKETFYCHECFRGPVIPLEIRQVTTVRNRKSSGYMVS